MKRISPEEAYEKCIDKKKFRPFLPHPPDDEENRTRSYRVIHMRRIELDHSEHDAGFPRRRSPTCCSPSDRPLQVESFGELKPVTVDPPIDALTPYQTESIALT